eukprot:CAMPEP_0177759460 /NCGR_PEP_ID=MMETSP0491_2-20121128/4746_1 /TAXON_ID=63592 /ORGANISM="Tetraselmis chuii, Strain PLY429" /LENGTH=39 /DNA_ID= /DNA_START= /DNA_END= /DNA_ORIENTATION=
MTQASPTDAVATPQVQMPQFTKPRYVIEPLVAEAERCEL